MQDWREKPPEARQVTDVVIERFDHVFEVDPKLMQGTVKQHDMPAWDTKRIMDARWDYIAWMHRHWADDFMSFDADTSSHGQ